MRSRTVLSLSSCVLAFAATTNAANIVIDDFEGSEGHFTSAPSVSGTTTGEVDFASGVDPSTAELELGISIFGDSSQRIFMDDDTAADVPSTSPVQTWRLRHLSGGGTPANNLSLVADGYIGFYLRTTTPDLQASIFIDDGLALERASYTPIISDGDWHLYEWSFDDAAQWEGFAGTGSNGAIDAANVTIDGIFISAIKTAGDQDAVFNIDYVAANPDGRITAVPEPASLGLLLFGAGCVGMRRRR